MSTPDERRIWGPADRVLALMARNISTRYLAIAVDGVIGLLMMPFNVAHLGQSAYGLWVLTTSITFYFSVLDLGYGGALVKFIAQYRAWRDRQALNEILSTMFVVYTAVGVITFLMTAGIAWQFGRLFRVTPDQVATGQSVLLVIGSYIAVRFAAAIFGGVVVGFQRYYLNNLISICTSICVALVTYSVLTGGADLVTLVISTTAVRVLALGGFVLTGYLVYPGLQVSTALFRRQRLREVTGFSRVHPGARLVGKAELLDGYTGHRSPDEHVGSHDLDGGTAYRAGVLTDHRPTDHLPLPGHRRQ